MTTKLPFKSCTVMLKNIFSVLVILLFANRLFAQNTLSFAQDTASKNVTILTNNTIPQKYIFYKGDSLNGFDWKDYYGYINNSPGGIKSELELRHYLHRTERNYIQTKYHIPQAPTVEAINPNNVSTLTSACNNVDFEDGNFTGWTGYIGDNTNSNAALNNYSTGIFNGALNNAITSCEWHTLISAAAGNDPYGNFPMLDPGGGTYAARLGDPYINLAADYDFTYQCGNFNIDPDGTSMGEVLQETFPVTAANSLFTYNYAVILNDGGHSNGQEPYFRVEVLDQNNNDIPCLQYYIQVSNGVVPTGFARSAKTSPEDGTPVYYLPWTSNSLNLTAYIGQNVTVRFTAAGCTLGGHFAYAYVDCSCSHLSLTTTSVPCTPSMVITAPPGAQSYSWTEVPVGTGITSGGTTQSATVNQSGTYQVTVTTSTGCFYTLDTTVVVTPNLVFTASASPTSICPGSSSVLTATGAAGNTYSWSPSGATTNPVTVTPVTTTTYTVTGTSTTGCTGTQTVTVTVNPLPAVTVNSPTICTGNATLTAVAPAGSTYSWSTAATTAAITVNPVATTSYTVTGTSAAGCTNSAVATVTVSPNLSITVNSPTICAGTSATLTPTGGTTYSWNTTATTSTLTVTPTVTTSYTVTGTSAAGCTGSAVATVTVNPLPTVTVNSISICPTTSGTLTATGASTYAWAPALGLSGTTGASVTANPTVTTSYTVTGTDVNGCTGTAVAVVTLNGTLTVTVNSPSICVGAAGTLTATGPPAGSTYSWSDGETTNAITVTPAAATSYTVTGTSPSGCTGSAVATVTVNPLPPVTVNSPSICTGTSTSLTGVGAETYSWTAGLSGTTGTTVTANPATTTSYTVTGTDANGCTNTAVSTVTVNPSPAPSFTSTTVCFNNATAFTDASTTTVGTITAWSWNFGEPSSGANNTSTTQNPTHTYGSSGTFNVKLIVTNSTGCIDSVTLPIIVNPLPIASFTTASVCSGTAMNFTDASTISSGTITDWAWNFGDPGSGVNNTSTVQSPSHTFNTAGNYVVTLTVTSNNGCQGTTTQTVTVNPIPVAAFTATSVCATTAMSFTDGSTVATGTITSWAWNFGDGGTSTVQTPTHTYATSGNFTVTLTVTGTGGCTNTVTNTVTVFPNPVASFTSTSVCLNNITDFTDASTVSAGTITGWAWTFGDGTSSTLQNPTHTYAASGVYNVKLTVTSSNGCSNTISETATVYPLPVAAFTNTTVCQNSPTSFTDASTISSGSITNWSWTFGDGNTSTAQSPLHLYAIDSTYIVKLVVTSNNGCVDSITQNVTVNPNPVVAFTVNDSAGCAPLCVDFTDHSTVANGGTINAWLWNYGDGNTGTSENPGHCYTAPGSYDVMLTVTSNNNCSTTYTHNNMINVYPVPVAAFTMNPQTATMENPLISFVDQSTGATGWHWNFGDGDTLTWGANDNNPTHAYGDTGVFNVQLIVINQFGCTDTATHPIYIEPTFTFYAPNAFTPNGDGINDTFYGTGTGIVAYEMWIFDRWGNLIFHTTNLNDQWNGIVMGGSRIAQIDVYVWKVKLTDVFQKDHQYIGHVSLVR